MSKFNEGKNISQSINKDLPNNFLAEKIILSSLLISNDAIETTLKKVSVEMFYFKNHQEIYKSIIFLYQNKNSVDILTLITFLQDQGLLETIGGIKVLTELMNSIPNLIYLEEYINLVQDKFLRRLLIQWGYKIINSSYITNIPLENIFDELEKQFCNLMEHRQNFKILSSAELFSTVFLDLKQKSLNPTLPGTASGFHDLDSLTQGFQNSDLIIVAGRPSMGKTAFCLNTTINILKMYKCPVLFFSLEMSKEQLIYRILANEIKVPTTRLKVGQLNERDWIKLNHVIKTFSTLPLFIVDNPTLSIQDIRSNIKKVIFEQKNIGLIVIDYLQLIGISGSQPQNRVQELCNITRSLKSIAREFKVPLITLSQLSRNVENRLNKRPILSDLRESGSIEQDADLVLMLYRDSYYNKSATKTNIAELNIVVDMVQSHFDKFDKI